MSNDDLPTRVIADDLRFRHKLRIGEDAYAGLKAKRTLQEVAGVAGAAWAGSAIAASPFVASTFFAPTGIAAFFGLVAAATPVGWVIAGGALAGGVYIAINKALGSSGIVETVPAFIQSSVDELGQLLFGVIGSLAVNVALSDGEFDERERQTILDNFILDWGFDPTYARQVLEVLESRSDGQDILDLSRAFSTLVENNPDCNAAAIRSELFEMLEDVMKADGEIRASELAAIAEIKSGILSFSASRLSIPRA